MSQLQLPALHCSPKDRGSSPRLTGRGRGKYLLCFTDISPKRKMCQSGYWGSGTLFLTRKGVRDECYRPDSGWQEMVPQRARFLCQEYCNVRFIINQNYRYFPSCNLQKNHNVIVIHFAFNCHEYSTDRLWMLGNFGRKSSLG